MTIKHAKRLLEVGIRTSAFLLNKRDDLYSIAVDWHTSRSLASMTYRFCYAEQLRWHLLHGGSLYIPQSNREASTPAMWEFMRQHPLCAVVTQTADGMIASHIPMVLEEDELFGVLRGHVARANLQWNSLMSQEALVIFSGPEHYISASWYPGKLDHGKEVPTWNYAAVHAYGNLRIMEDPQWLLNHLHALTDQSEVIAEVPWKVSDAPAEFIQKLIGGIVGFELPIHKIEGKWKVSQNRNKIDVAGVLAGLATVPTSASLKMSELITSHRPTEE